MRGEQDDAVAARHARRCRCSTPSMRTSFASCFGVIHQASGTSISAMPRLSKCSSSSRSRAARVELRKAQLDIAARGADEADRQMAQHRSERAPGGQQRRKRQQGQQVAAARARPRSASSAARTAAIASRLHSHFASARENTRFRPGNCDPMRANATFRAESRRCPRPGRRRRRLRALAVAALPGRTRAPQRTALSAARARARGQ